MERTVIPFHSNKGYPYNIENVLLYDLNLILTYQFYPTEPLNSTATMATFRDSVDMEFCNFLQKGYILKTLNFKNVRRVFKNLCGVL